jgi:O-antigen ligase
LFLKNRKYFIAGVLVVTLTAGIVLGVFPDGNMSVRIKDMLNPQGRTIPARLLVWKSSINMFKDRPLTGVGWECYRKAYPAYMIKKEGVHWVNFRKRVFSHAHSNFLNIAAETGIFGLAAFLWVLISIVISSANIYRNTRDKMLKTTALSCLAVFLVFFISGVTEYNFGDSEVAMLFYFLLGITFAIPRIETIL